MSQPPTPPDLPPNAPPAPTPPPPPAPSAPPPPPPAGGDTPPPPQSTSSNRGIMIVLSYIWFLVLIPFLTEKEDQEIQWHAKHGLVLMIAGIGLMLTVSFLTSVIFDGCIDFLLATFGSLGLVVVHVVAIVKGLNGDRLIVPGVSQYVEKF